MNNVHRAFILCPINYLERGSEEGSVGWHPLINVVIMTKNYKISRERYGN